jgi:hypothetical protein
VRDHREQKLVDIPTFVCGSDTLGYLQTKLVAPDLLVQLEIYSIHLQLSTIYIANGIEGGGGCPKADKAATGSSRVGPAANPAYRTVAAPVCRALMFCQTRASKQRVIPTQNLLGGTGPDPHV